MYIPPIEPTRERQREEMRSANAKPVDSKVKGFVLERIAQAGGGALLPSATAPQIVLDLLPAFDAKMEHAKRSKQKTKSRKSPLVRMIPIGLRPVDLEGWINAFMQFVLFVPSFSELFFFAPRSFQPFRDFMDQYHLDQQEGRSLSSVHSLSLVRCLSAKFPLPRIMGEERFYQILYALMDELHPNWEIYPDLEGALQTGRPQDLLIAPRKEALPTKQFFTQPDSFCYDLDAFIELRPDGAAANFITYVKIDGGWYQCDDERITLLRSNCLSVPLNRSILLHYKRIAFSKTGWF